MTRNTGVPFPHLDGWALNDYTEKLRENPDEVFKEQVMLVSSSLQAAKDFPLTKEEHLKLGGELRK